MTENKKLIETARAQFKADVAAERDIRDEARKDIDFRAGEQWNAELKRQREEDGRPALTFDKTHVYIQSVANEARQNKPQPKVNPISGGANVDTANVLNGILRHVQYRSQADIASDTALDYSAGSSFGFIRAITEYADPKSFDQEVRILPVLDPFSIYGVLIPACRGQVCRHAFVVQTISKEEYRQRFSTNEEPVNFDSSEWRDCDDWIDGDKVRIAEYWYVCDEKKTLRLVDNLQGGDPIPIYTDDEDYDEGLPFITGKDGLPMERKVDIPCVKFCTMDGTRVIPGTETEWVGDSIPIVPVLGQQLIVDGEVHLFSLIRFIRDTQQLINIYESAIAEKIGLANRVPYVGAEGQFADPKWLDANKKNYPFLEYKVTTLNGQPVPPPQRQQLEENIVALSQALAQEIENLKSGMGIFDASLGARSNESSGVGIERRQQQASVTNFHFADNLNRAEWDLCAKLLKVIPKIYDRPGRQVRIVGEDQQHSVVVVNAQYQDPETGKEKHYPLDVGEYDVVVTIGPSYATARAEGADTLGQLFKVAPQLVPLMGDLWVGSLDYTWAAEGARRLKAAAPQDIVNEPEKGQLKIPPQVQQALERNGQTIEQLTALVHQLQNEIDTKKVETDSRERIAALQEETKRSDTALQEETKRAVEFAKLNQAAGMAVLTEELAAIRQRVDLMHQAGVQDAQREHAAAMQDATQQHAAEMQGAQQGHESEQAQLAQQQQQQMPEAA